MQNEFTAIIEEDDDFFIAYCPEIPGANGQEKTIEECKKNLSEAISLILKGRRKDGIRCAPPEAKQAFFVDGPCNWGNRSGSAPSRNLKQACKEDLKKLSVPEIG